MIQFLLQNSVFFELSLNSEPVPQKPYKIIVPPKGWSTLQLREVWRFRELLYFLTWRDIKVRYKQTALGAVWAILQPLLTMVIFSVIFGGLAKLPSEGFPYPIFTFAALLPWQLFAFALNSASQSLVGNQNLISKVYFPRLVVPFLTQFWMYATPIAYTSSLIPEKWRWLYSLNPMTGVVEGFRWALLGKSGLDTFSLGVSTFAVIFLLVSGLFYFKRMETSFADII